MAASENASKSTTVESDELPPLSEAQIATLEALLIEARDSLVGGIEDSSEVATDEDSADDPSARLAARTESSALNQQMTEQMIAIDRALERIAEGVYGECEACGVTIPVERLEAVPSAVQCVACQ